MKGQAKAKRALEIAAAEGHHLLMMGTPGSGKAMLAKRMPGLLPLLGREEALARELYVQPSPQALKTELYRLRQAGFHVASRPYRLTTPIEADLLRLQQALKEGRLEEALALYQGPLLPRSQAPGIERLRHQLEEQLKEAVLQQPSPEALYLLAQRIPEDLILWEALLRRLPPDDPRRPGVLAWVRRLSAGYC